MPVTDGVWLPKHFAMKSRAKILFVISHNTQEDDTYFGYHRRLRSTTNALHTGALTEPGSPLDSTALRDASLCEWQGSAK